MRTQRLARLLQSGFTLIELIIVVVIIGILAAVAIPRFTDVQAAAAVGALQGAGAAISSASATNYALRSGNIGGTALTTCADAAGLATIPTNMVATGTGLPVNGTSALCTLTSTGPAASTTFPAFGAP